MPREGKSTTRGTKSDGKICPTRLYYVMQLTYSNYRSRHHKSKAIFPFSRTEATATLWLQRRILSGIGPRHLGCRSDEYELLADGSEILKEEAGPRVWNTPPENEGYKWRLLLDHLRGSKYPVDWRFASTFLSVVEYCLITSPNEDDRFPKSVPRRSGRDAMKVDKRPCLSANGSGQFAGAGWKAGALLRLWIGIGNGERR